MKIISISTFAATSFALLFYFYRSGVIDSHTIASLLFDKKIINPYNGTYIFDADSVENVKIIESIKRAESLQYDPLVLHINDSGATLLGFQYRSKVKNSFFTVCLNDNGFSMSNGGLYCTNGLRDSLCESSVVAGRHEQLVLYEVQDQELAFVQHSAEAARFAIDLV